MRKNKINNSRGGCLGILLLILLCTGVFIWNQGSGSRRSDSVDDDSSTFASIEPLEPSPEETESSEAVSTEETEAPDEPDEPVKYVEVPYYRPELFYLKLPERYDRREHSKLPPVKDQGELGTCWAFAALMAMESALGSDELLDFSEDHMSNNQHFGLSQNEGGEYTMALAYLLSRQGPVLEEEDPYGDGFSPEGLSAVKHLQEVQFLPKKDYEAIKKAVYLQGGVQSSLYTQLKNADSESRYYEREHFAYCYDGEHVPNHEIVIIGWDDEYPKENFSIDVPDNGAFICANSWGTSFGDEGFFYVSYFDTNIGLHNVLYTQIEDADNYNYIYQSDLCGWIGALGYGGQGAWAANVYQAGNQEILRAAGFYAVGDNTRYEFYIVRHVEEEPDFSDRQLIAKGKVNVTGYYTIPVREEVILEKDERFAVVMMLTTPDSVHPVAIEYDAGDGKSRIDLSDGEGYISLQGDIWESAEKEQNCNLCLKVYTDRY